MTSRISRDLPCRRALQDPGQLTGPSFTAGAGSRGRIVSPIYGIDPRLVSRICLETIRTSRGDKHALSQPLLLPRIGRCIKRSQSEASLHLPLLDGYNASTSPVAPILSPTRAIQPDKREALIGALSRVNHRLAGFKKALSSLLEGYQSLPSRKIREFLSINLKSIKQMQLVARSVARVLEKSSSVREIEKSESFLLQSSNYLDELERALEKLAPFISTLRENEEGFSETLSPFLNQAIKELSEMILLVREYKNQLALSKRRLDSSNVLGRFSSLGINKGLRDFVDAEVKALHDLVIELSREMDLNARKLKRDLTRLSFGGEEDFLLVDVAVSMKGEYSFNLSFRQLDECVKQLLAASLSRGEEVLSDTTLGARTKALSLIDETLPKEEELKDFSSSSKVRMLTLLRETVIKTTEFKSYLQEWKTDYDKRAIFFDNLELLEDYNSDFIAIFDFVISCLVDRTGAVGAEGSAPIKVLTSGEKRALSNELIDFATLEALRESSSEVLQYPCSHYVSDSSYQSALLHAMLRVPLLWDALNQKEPIQAIKNNKEMCLADLKEQNASSMVLACPCCHAKVLED